MLFGIGLIVVVGLLAARSEWRKEHRHQRPLQQDIPEEGLGVIGTAVFLDLILKDSHKDCGGKQF
jgi:hypothetical protein